MATKTGEVKYEGEGYETIGSVYENDNGEFVSWRLGESWGRPGLWRATAGSPA